MTTGVPTREEIVGMPGTIARRASLLAVADRPLTPGEAEELASLEAVHDRFRRMCVGWTPINPLALGVPWDAWMEHEDAPGAAVHVRAGGMVLQEGEERTLVEATRVAAKEARRGIAIGGWRWRDRRIADLAGLEHPPRTAPARSVKTAPRPAMDDLFG